MNIRYGISWTDVRRGRLAFFLAAALAAFMAFGPARASAELTADDLAAPQSLASVRDAIGATTLQAAGQGIDVAVIDSGTVAVPGLDAAGKVTKGPDFSSEATDPDLAGKDTYGHGTHIAGIVAGNDAETGFQGIAPGARVVSVKAASADGTTTLTQLIDAINWTVNNRNTGDRNIRVINLSFGANPAGAYLDDPLAAAVERAWQHGVVVVVSAGNNGLDVNQLDSPAFDPFVIAVGGYRSMGNADPADDVMADWSSSGNVTRSPDVVAPGSSIVSLRDPGSYLDVNHPEGLVGTEFFKGSGTSQAAGVVSGAVADLLQAEPGLTPDQVKAKLMASASPLADVPTTQQGAGRIDIAAAANADVGDATQSWDVSPLISEIGTDPTPTSSDTPTDPTVQVVAPGGTTSTGGTWDGSRWSGSRWSGSRWSGSRWTGSGWGL